MDDNEYRKMIKKALGLAASLGQVEYRVGENSVGFYVVKWDRVNTLAFRRTL
jgi:hypothetical protein